MFAGILIYFVLERLFAEIRQINSLQTFTEFTVYEDT